ncbi:HD domain-containing protein, partial [bacterium]|nr:HD domain-containing protein [bacterium]
KGGMEKMGIPVLFLNKDLRICEANSSLLSLLKCNKKELLNRKIYEIFPQISEKKLPERLEIEIGKKVFLLLIIPFREEFIAFFIDITQEKKKEKKLREELALFSAITETALIGTFVMENERIIYVNNSLARIFECKKENLMKKNPLSFVFSEDRELVREKLREVEEKKGVSFIFRGLKGKKRKVIYLKIFLSLIHEEAPKIVGTLMDITEEVKAREERRKAHERLNRIYRATIEAFGKTIEARDPYTAGHQLRVAEISCLIGKEMGLEERKLRALEIAGRLHDIGKIGVPSEILTKPGKLTEEEFDLVKKHPVIGYEILKTIPFNLPVAKIVLQHHERIDGSGYPYGLKDGQILLEARILAVADTFEAMVSHRPYRPAHSVEEVIKEMEKGKGKKYDKRVVSALLIILKKGLLAPLFSDKRNSSPSFYCF